jgi:predicted acetyltransferase
MPDSSDPVFGPIRDDSDMARIGRLLHHAFAGPLDKCEEWARKAGPENFRVLTESGTDGAMHACSLRIPMGQFFGGRAVKMLGVAGVATAPESRGKGHALRMMQAFVRQAAADGYPISTLYPSTQTLYRQVGYEQAGYRFEITIPATGLSGGERGPTPRPLTDDDAAHVRACYDSWAANFDGLLDRGEYVWSRVKTLRENVFEGFGFFGEDGRLDGYVYLMQNRKPESGRFDIAISDVAWVTERAGRAILKFLSDFTTMADNIVLNGGPGHPILMLMDGVKYECKRKDYWMVRVLRVKDALEARGYPPALKTTIAFDVRDELLPENAGRWVLRIEDGRGAVTNATSNDSPECPVLRVSERGLAALFAGYVTPRQAVLTGLVEGDEKALESATGIFASAGGGSGMGDMF